MKYIKIFEQFDKWDPFGEEIIIDKKGGIIDLITNVLNNLRLEYSFESDLEGLEYHNLTDVIISGTKNNWILHFDHDYRKDFIMMLKEYAPENLHFKMSSDLDKKNKAYKYILHLFTTDENFEDQFEYIQESFDFDENDPFGEESKFDSTDAYEKIIEIVSDIQYKYKIIISEEEYSKNRLDLFRHIYDFFILETPNKYSLYFGFYFKRKFFLKQIKKRFPHLNCYEDRGGVNIVLNVIK